MIEVSQFLLEIIETDKQSYSNHIISSSTDILGNAGAWLILK